MTGVGASSCISVDMDALRCYAAIHGIESDLVDADPVWTVGMPRFLELFERSGVKATFFCVGRDLEVPEHAALARLAAAAGHEIASHSHSHHYDLRARGPEAISADIERAEQAIDRAVGARPVGFRTPGYNLSPEIARALVARGYLYDSSIFPCPPYYGAKGLIMARMRLSGAPSRSQMTLPHTLLAPTAPYLADPDRPWRRARSGGLWEIPMSLVPGLRFPLIGTSLHLIGARGFRALMPLLRRAHPSLFNLELHGIDLLDEADAGTPEWLRTRQPDLKVPVDAKRRLYTRVFESLGRAYTHKTLRDAVGGA